VRLSVVMSFLDCRGSEYGTVHIPRLRRARYVGITVPIADRHLELALDPDHTGAEPPRGRERLYVAIDPAQGDGVLLVQALAVAAPELLEALAEAAAARGRAELGAGGLVLVGRVAAALVLAEGLWADDGEAGAHDSGDFGGCAENEEDYDSVCGAG
jgi:hypothetical protein